MRKSFTFLFPFATCLADKKNVLFILSDDLGWNDVGWNNPLIHTPNLDELLQKSHLLSNYYVQHICTPTRTTLLTGRTQTHIGLQHSNIKPCQPNSIPLEEKLLPEYFKECGYRTAHVGKWHAGMYTKEATPTYRGYDHFLGYLLGAETYWTKERCEENRSTGVHLCGLDFHRNEAPDNSTYGVYSAKVYTDYVTKFIQESGPHPWFLMLALQNVHGPIVAPEEFIQMYAYVKDEKRRIHMGMVTAMDFYLGKLLQHVDLENTIVVFSSDNGGQTMHGGNNWPLRGRKSYFYEGGVKAPGFIYPKSLPIRPSQLFHITDWLPTLLSLNTCKRTSPLPLDGFDLTQPSKTNTTLRREILFNIDELTRTPTFASVFEQSISQRTNFDVRTLASLRNENYKVITGPPEFSEWVKPPELGAETDNKLRFSAGDSEEIGNIQLFKLDTDPLEKHNLASYAEYLPRLEFMLRRLAWHNRTAVPVRYPADDVDARPIDGFWRPWK